MPMRSVPRLLATVGMEMLTILVAVPEKKRSQQSRGKKQAIDARVHSISCLYS